MTCPIVGAVLAKKGGSLNEEWILLWDSDLWPIATYCRLDWDQAPLVLAQPDQFK